MKKKYIFIFLAAAFCFWASWQTRLVLTGGGEPGNTPAAEQTVTMPPLVALTTVALGGFRGLIVDLLWMRLINLQKEGKVFEIAQLADWITKLEPQFTTVWAFHAWNMAYNISILYANPEHRWLWVNNGIELLRDNALQYNPRAPDLYRDLGWIYQHKIGQTMDDMHLYYKQKLAREMNDLLAGPRPDFAAPDSVLARRLRAEYKLFPEIMQAIEHDYGRLDWRLPETHALYWAYRGRQNAGPGQDTTACDHMIFQAMAAAFEQGRLFADPDEGIYSTTPRLDLLPGVIKAYEDALKRQPTDPFKKAYVGFLAEAVFVFHAYGDDQTASKLFEKMLAEDPRLRQKMNFEKYIRQCEQFKIAELPAAVATAWIEGLLYQSHARPPVRTETGARELRAKALLLREQYMAGRPSWNNRENLPPFALIDEMAKQRAGEK